MDSENQRQIKKTKRQNERDDQTNLFDQLPYETVIDILSRLPITSLIQFSFVSRSSISLSHDPHLVDAHLSRSAMNGGSSCLIFHSDYPIQNQLHFLQFSDEKEKVRKIDTPFAASMPEFSILGSSNGLLCLINTLFPESMSLYNPFTRFYLELPKNFIFQDHVVVFGFGFRSVTNDYKVIKIAYYANASFHPMYRHLRGFKTNYNGKVSEVQIYSLSSNTWKNGGVVPYQLEKYSSPGVLAGGRLHWVSRWGRFNGRFQRVIVSYNLADDSFQEIKNPGSASGSFGRWVGCQLAALGGCLCAAVPVPPGHGAFNIWVMKEYGVDESWVMEYSIGAYHPVSMISHKMEKSSHIWRNMFARKLVQILCIVESGELLVEYRGGGLASYDFANETFRELVFPGMPMLYQTTFHVGSLKSAAFPA